MVVISKKSVQQQQQVNTELPIDLSSLLVSKQTYGKIGEDFHLFHRHDLNVAGHLVTTSLGVWGAIQLAMHLVGVEAVYIYLVAVALTTPLLTAVIHTAMGYGMTKLAAMTVLQYLTRIFPALESSGVETWHVSVAALALGFVLQELSHYLAVEGTFMDSYMKQGRPWMLLLHSFWLLPLVIDSVLIRHFFLPKLLVTRNRNVIAKSVASRPAIEALRDWIHSSIPSSLETTHVWPHKQEGTAAATLLLEKDQVIEDQFRTVFAKHHYDIMPIQGMNEIYVTAVGAKKSINSDAVFYTPHTDGPFWFLPGASCYRVLVGLTPNQMVRTRFNLQHETQDQILDMYGVVGFDYNRELHWIDHVPGAKNAERRSLMKLHYVVYPKGWHSYGKFCAYLNTTYNTWARGNFLKTLRPEGAYEYVMAWWIWLTTWFNAIWEETFGWSNLVYVLATFLCGPKVFLVATSFRHYATYMATFAFRSPPVAHGYLMRDAKLFKTIALLHLGRRLLPLVDLPRDIPGLTLALAGFCVTLMATAQLGMVRTYFGSELGFVKPNWISGFPYNCIPHPMIVGQLFAFGNILYWWNDRITTETMYLVMAHMSCYTLHMVQEMFTSSY